MPSYTEIDLQNALRDIEGGISRRVAAQRYGIPCTTLNNRMNGAESQQASHEDQQRLSNVQEGHLRDWVLAQQALGVPLTHTQLREFAVRILAA